jgi:hypothetical protein
VKLSHERLDGLLNGCFMARMSFLIALGTLILKILFSILKKAEFYKGLMPVFCPEVANGMAYTALRNFTIVVNPSRRPLQQNLQRPCIFRLLLAFGYASASIISLSFATINY